MANLSDAHRGYAEVMRAVEMISYVENVRVQALA